MRRDSEPGLIGRGVRPAHASITQAYAHAHIKDRAPSSERAETRKITLQQHYYYAIQPTSSPRHVRKGVESSQPSRHFASLNNTQKFRPELQARCTEKIKLQDTLNLFNILPQKVAFVKRPKVYKP